jgi:hypothetical protein
MIPGRRAGVGCPRAGRRRSPETLAESPSCNRRSGGSDNWRGNGLTQSGAIRSPREGCSRTQPPYSSSHPSRGDLGAAAVAPCSSVQRRHSYFRRRLSRPRTPRARSARTDNRRLSGLAGTLATSLGHHRRRHADAFGFGGVIAVAAASRRPPVWVAADMPGRRTLTGNRARHESATRGWRCDPRRGDPPHREHQP